METGRQKEGQAALSRCLPLYRAWGQADPAIVTVLERNVAAGR